MVTIKEVADELSVTAYTIRYYEKEGLMRVPRNERGVRDFDERAINRLKSILHYRNVGMSLEDIRQVLANYDDHNFSLKLLTQTKRELDDKIAELEATREYLMHKIAIHQELAEKENAARNRSERNA